MGPPTGHIESQVWHRGGCFPVAPPRHPLPGQWPGERRYRHKQLAAGSGPLPIIARASSTLEARPGPRRERCDARPVPENEVAAGCSPPTFARFAEAPRRLEGISHSFCYQVIRLSACCPCPLPRTRLIRPRDRSQGRERGRGESCFAITCGSTDSFIIHNCHTPWGGRSLTVL